MPRIPEAPDAARLTDYEEENWIGLVAPAKTPKETVSRFASWFTKKGLQAIQVEDEAPGSSEPAKKPPAPSANGRKPDRAPASRRKGGKTEPPRTRAEPKQATVIAMLSRPQGTTIVAIMRETGWQQHSVRGFFAGVVRNKLGLILVSEKLDGERVYRIVSPHTRKGKPGRTAA
jgi:hypothetical protein